MACSQCEVNGTQETCEIQRRCREGMMLALDHCKHDRRKSEKERAGPATFTFAEEDGAFFDAGGRRRPGRQIQVHRTNLCLHREEGRGVALRRCDPAKREQRFLGLQAGGRAMELAPLVRGTLWHDGVERRRCLTQVGFLYFLTCAASFFRNCAMRTGFFRHSGSSYSSGSLSLISSISFPAPPPKAGRADLRGRLRVGDSERHPPVVDVLRKRVERASGPGTALLAVALDSSVACVHWKHAVAEQQGSMLFFNGKAPIFDEVGLLHTHGNWDTTLKPTILCPCPFLGTQIKVD